MPACPRCQSVNPEGYRFCGSCGSALEALDCPSCGRANPLDQAFCGQCGTSLAGGTAALVDRGLGTGDGGALEERKLATVLFADVVGFTSLSERTDPEVVAHMVDAAFQEMGRVVAEHGGTVDKYMGDSLMAVFGVPTAHDDDAERAVAAGLAMRKVGGDLVFAIGINSGEVMVSAVGRGDVTVIGDTVNVAARLEKAAGPGEVLVGRLTADLARRRVEFEERQPVLLKGKQEPVEVFAAQRLRRGSDGSGAPATPLVGRDQELAFLETQWQRVVEDHQAALVVVCGEAGAGKSRLLEELAADAGDRALVVRTDYPAYGVLGGLQVAAELIDQLGPSADAEVETRVRSVLGELDPTLRAMDATGLEREQVWALGRLVAEKAADRPLLVLVDDLHGGDDKTLGLLAQLATHLRELPLLTVVAGRTEPGGWLSRFAAATTLRLRPLARSHAEDLAEALAGGPLAPEARQFFADVAKGNPLYLRELLSMVRARDMLVEDDDGFRLSADRAVPATLQALLAARLDALERNQKVVFQHLALLGEASDKELNELGGRYGGTELAALAQGGLVRTSLDGRFEVADLLLGEVAYDMLPRTARGELHRRAAMVVERPEDRVGHLERAADYLADDPAVAAEAAEALAAEGHTLAEGFRHLDAIRLLEKSVVLGMRRPTVLLELARLQGACGKEDEALVNLALIPDDPDDPTLAVERDHTAGTTKLFVDPAASLPRLLEAADRWRALGDVGKEAWAHANAGVAYFYVSQMENSARELEHSLELFESIGDRHGGLAAASFLCLAKPEDPRVEQWLADSLAFADETGDRNRQAATLATLTWRHFFKGMCGTTEEMAVAEGFALRLAAVADDLGATDMAVHGHSLRALMTRFAGRFDEARREIELLARGERDQRHHESWLAWSANFAVAVATDSPNAAAPFPPENTVDPVVAMATLMVNLALVLAGRHDEAVARLERDRPALAGSLADVGGVVAAAALIQTGLGELAVPILERAAQAARRLDATPALRAATAMLDELAGRVPREALRPGACSLADALLARAHARTGDAAAEAVLREMTATLGAPGLLVGFSS